MNNSLTDYVWGIMGYVGRACTGFGWDVDGDLLAIITSSSPHVILWDANTGKKSQVDTGLRDAMSCVRWSKRGSMLAVGTARGNLTIYNHSTAK
ncbi:hypothetical protein Cfor_04608 [Coptotermes formosanus]|uniref:WDR19 first beta-propeller domain-containing protein n=1 Tax=Coptotermes formosanus TaxID=36987 RepID=A0A6L2PEZ9_COPFO|nr:hypothetical protein Cfor_04608 [Coptotermes formosanus]